MLDAVVPELGGEKGPAEDLLRLGPYYRLTAIWFDRLEELADAGAG